MPADTTHCNGANIRQCEWENRFNNILLLLLSSLLCVTRSLTRSLSRTYIPQMHARSPTPRSHTQYPYILKLIIRAMNNERTNERTMVRTVWLATAKRWYYCCRRCLLLCGRYHRWRSADVLMRLWYTIISYMKQKELNRSAAPADANRMLWLGEWASVRANATP